MMEGKGPSSPVHDEGCVFGKLGKLGHPVWLQRLTDVAVHLESRGERVRVRGWRDALKKCLGHQQVRRRMLLCEVSQSGKIGAGQGLVQV